MQTNGKPVTEQVREFRIPPFAGAPKPQPLAKVEQTASQMQAKLDLVRQQNELKLEAMMGKVATINAAIPTINATIGDPNHQLQQLAAVVLQRGCDCAEDIVEIVISEEE